MFLKLNNHMTINIDAIDYIEYDYDNSPMPRVYFRGGSSQIVTQEDELKIMEAVIYNQR